MRSTAIPAGCAMRPGDIDSRLREWADCYGGGRYDNLGYASENVLYGLGVMGGFCPDPSGRIPSREATPADQVEAAVRRMEQDHRARWAAILRNWYFRPNIAMSHRIKLMASVGFQLSESAFIEQLPEARAAFWQELTRVAT